MNPSPRTWRSPSRQIVPITGAADALAGASCEPLLSRRVVGNILEPASSHAGTPTMALRADLHFPDAEHLANLFEVHRFEMLDVLSGLFEVSVTAFSVQPDVEPKTLIGLTVEARLHNQPLLPKIKGIVRSARRYTVETTGTTEYSLTVVPREWLLTRARQSWIYQQKTGVDIVREVLSRHGPAMPQPIGAPPSRIREYCVQYEETDFEMISRVLADDGITTLFDHRNGGAWVMTSDTAAGSTLIDDAIPWNPSNLTPDGPAVLRWEELADIETTRVARRDYDFTKPGFTLEAQRTSGTVAAAEATLEDYSYAVGAFDTDAGGQALVTTLLEAARATARTLRLRTNFAIGAGARIPIRGPDIRGDWVVVRSHTRLDQTGGDATVASHELVVTAADVPYRPRLLPKPRIHGVQTAFVVGDSPIGTVDADKYGRVKVEFRWDRRDLGKGNPTRLVRVAQAWAGAGYGLVTLPRVGDEVLVAYSEGDLDLPLVIGRVHNAVSATPLSLPVEDATKSIWKSQSFGPEGPVEGFNMILMDDTAGEEQMALHAQLDYAERIERDMSSSVGRNRTTHIEGDDSTNVQGSQTLVVQGTSDSRTKGGVSMYGGTIQIQSGGTMKLHAKGNMTLSTDADRTDQSGSNHFIDAASLYISVKDVVQINAAHFHVFARGDIRLVCGGSSIIVSPGGIKIASSGDVEVNGALIKLNC